MVDSGAQSIANIFHAMATLHVVDIGLIRRLSDDMTHMPISASNPQVQEQSRLRAPRSISCCNFAGRRRGSC